MFKVLGLRILGVLATFGLGVYLARTLGDAGYGAYAFVIGLAGFLATIGQFGSGMALVKLRLGQDDLSAAETRGLYAWHVILSGCGVAVLALIAAQVPSRAYAFGPGLILAVALATLAGLIVTNAYQSVRQSSLAILPATLLVPLCVIALTWTLGLDRADRVLIVYAGAAAVFLAVFAALFLVRFGTLPPGRSAEIRWGPWSRFGLTFLVAQFGHALLFMLLPAAYGFIAEPAEMGQFSAAYRLSAATLITFNAVMVYATPFFADHTVMADPTRLRGLMRRIVGLSVATALPVLVLLLALPATLTLWLYGPGYEAAGTLLPVLALGICVHAATGPMGNFLLMNGAARFYNTVSVIAGLAGTAALLVAGLAGGAMAAAWAMTAALIVWKGLIVLRAWKLYLNLTRGGAPDMPAGKAAPDTPVKDRP